MRFLPFAVFCACAGFFCAANAQAPSEDFFARLTPEEAAKTLANFRGYRTGDQRLRALITHAERNSDEEAVFTAEICATWTKAGRIVRVDIASQGKPDSFRRFLIVDGASPAVYTLSASGVPTLAEAAALNPLMPGLVFTPYDLQLPFVRWSDFKYTNTERHRGRRTDNFRMTPPADFARAHPEISSVTLGFDHDHNALMRATTFDAKGSAAREIRAENFGRIRDTWVIAEISLTDKRTRASDTLKILSGTIGEFVSASVFDPQKLAEALPSIPDSRFVELK